MGLDGLIDLRSDTVTRPTPAMRRAMAEAMVGDDVLDGDPTTRLLEQRIAELLGMEAALFFPSGVQVNQTAIWVLTRPGTEIVLEADSHIVHYEMAAAASLSGVQIRPVATPDGILTRELASAALRPPSPHLPDVSAIVVENTHNAAGGRVMPLMVWDGLSALAQDRELPLHLDGARLWNAAAALEMSLPRLTRGAASVSVCLSKGLGCPVGSCLAGSHALIEQARAARRRLGGAMRQSGILAAAGLYALDHHLDRLSEDHVNAALLAESLSDHPAIRVAVPDTNIVMLDLVAAGLTAEQVLGPLADAGVLLVPFGPTRLRAVTHLDVSADDVVRAAGIMRNVLKAVGG